MLLGPITFFFILLLLLRFQLMRFVRSALFASYVRFITFFSSSPSSSTSTVLIFYCAFPFDSNFPNVIVNSEHHCHNTLTHEKSTSRGTKEQTSRNRLRKSFCQRKTVCGVTERIETEARIAMLFHVPLFWFWGNVSGGRVVRVDWITLKIRNFSIESIYQHQAVECAATHNIAKQTKMKGMCAHTAWNKQTGEYNKIK